MPIGDIHGYMVEKVLLNGTTSMAVGAKHCSLLPTSYQCNTQSRCWE